MQIGEITSVKPTNSQRIHLSKPLLAVWFALFLCFIANAALHWPEFFNIVTFGFRDIGSFVHLDSLLAKGLRPGVDVGYTYGLLPLLVQHLLTMIFKNGYIALLVFDILYLLAMSFGWAFLWTRTGESLWCLALLISLSPFLSMGIAHAAHALLQCTIFAAIICIFEDKLSHAFVFAALGFLSMPSLPIALTCLLLGYVIFRLLLESNAKARSKLARTPLTGMFVFLVAATILALMFGFPSLWATLSPFAGADFYKQMGYGIFGAGFFYLFPAGAHLAFYLGTKVGWWLLSTLTLAWCASQAFQSAWTRRKISSTDAAVLFCFILHFTFIFFAFGQGFQTMYYDPILVCGILFSFSRPQRLAWVRATSLGLIVCGILAQTTPVRGALAAWKNNSRFPFTANLYATSAFAAEWMPILLETKSTRPLILSYGSGISCLYPQVDESESWFLLPGITKGHEKQRLLEKINRADLVAEEITGDIRYVDRDKQLQSALARFHHVETGKYFRVYRP